MAAAPRASDPIGGALRTAFASQQRASDDFAALLRQIDDAERASARN